MVYEIEFKALVKTFSPNTTHSEMENIIYNALSNSQEIRDIMIVDYKGDTKEDPKKNICYGTFEELRNFYLE